MSHNHCIHTKDFFVEALGGEKRERFGANKMDSLKHIVISKNIYSSNHLRTKAFFASLLIHGSLLATGLYIVHNQPVELPKADERVTVSISTLAPSFSQEKSPSKPIVKKVQHKPIKHIKKKSVKTPIVKQKTSQKSPKPFIKKKLLPSEAFTPHVSNDVTALTSDKEPLYSPKKISSETPKEALTTQNKSTQSISPTTLGLIRSLIQNSLTYPAIARKLKIEGVVVVSFVLTQDGRVENATIYTKSGSSSLDSKALKTVLALSGEYPHLSKKVDLRIPISFSLQNS